MLALLLPIWAWALPVLGPVLVGARRLLASGRSIIPGGVGTSVLGLAVVGILGALLWFQIDRWWNPPPRTYTAAEVELASAKAELVRLKRDIVAGALERQTRDASIDRLAEINNDVTTELEATRAKALQPDAVLVPADDPWLRAWARRGR
jgi:hypothetical protein